MKTISTAKTIWMLAATIVVGATLVQLQSGGRADESVIPRDAPAVLASPPTADSLTTPTSTSTNEDSTSQAGIRRLPPVATAPASRREDVTPRRSRAAPFLPPRTGQRPTLAGHVARASFRNESASTPQALQLVGAANGAPASSTANLPRTADDGHAYDNDLPLPNASAPVSLHLNEVSVRHALEALSRSHGINMLVAPGVTGSVTANLEGLDSESALNAILKLCKLVAHREKGLVFVYSDAEYPQLDFEVRTIPLDYVAGTDVLPVVSSLLSKSGQAFATAIDPLDNSKAREAIAIVDMPRVIQRAADYIRQVDVPPLQVMIEAHILQVILNEDCRHGINYDQVMQAVGTTGLELNVVGFADPLASPGVFARLTHTDIGALLHFLKETTDSKTLASPRVMVVNGQTAKIQVGEQIPYKVVTVTETLAIEEVRFLDVGVVLEVTPRISRDGHVMMRVKPKVSDGKFDPLSSLPGEETREVESDVVIRDGEGLVIGGLIQEKDSDIQTKIPWLGDMHYIGRMFQKREKVKIRTEVIITLIPRIRYPDGYTDRELVDEERTRTRLFHGPLDPTYRPWEPMLPDATENPLTWDMIRNDLNCQNCANNPCSCESYEGSWGIDKPRQPAESFPPPAPVEAGSGESLRPGPVPTESTNLVPPDGYQGRSVVEVSPPRVFVDP